MMTELSRDHHVVAIDLPGHGFTTLGASNRSGLTQMSEDIAALCKQEEWQPQKIIAHSAGAAIALQLCEHHLTPDTQPQSILAINPAFTDFDGLAGVLFPLMAKSLAVNPSDTVALHTWSRHHVSCKTVDRFNRVNDPCRAIVPVCKAAEGPQTCSGGFVHDGAMVVEGFPNNPVPIADPNGNRSWTERSGSAAGSHC